MVEHNKRTRTPPKRGGGRGSKNAQAEPSVAVSVNPTVPQPVTLASESQPLETVLEPLLDRPTLPPESSSAVPPSAVHKPKPIWIPPHLHGKAVERLLHKGEVAPTLPPPIESRSVQAGSALQQASQLMLTRRDPAVKTRLISVEQQQQQEAEQRLRHQEQQRLEKTIQGRRVQQSQATTVLLQRQQILHPPLPKEPPKPVLFGRWSPAELLARSSKTLLSSTLAPVVPDPLASSPELANTVESIAAAPPLVETSPSTPMSLELERAEMVELTTPPPSIVATQRIDPNFLQVVNRFYNHRVKAEIASPVVEEELQAEDVAEPYRVQVEAEPNSDLDFSQPLSESVTTVEPVAQVEGDLEGVNLESTLPIDKPPPIIPNYATDWVESYRQFILHHQEQRSMRSVPSSVALSAADPASTGWRPQMERLSSSYPSEEELASSVAELQQALVLLEQQAISNHLMRHELRAAEPVAQCDIQPIIIEESESMSTTSVDEDLNAAVEAVELAQAAADSAAMVTLSEPVEEDHEFTQALNTVEKLRAGAKEGPFVSATALSSALLAEPVVELVPAQQYEIEVQSVGQALGGAVTGLSTLVTGAVTGVVGGMVSQATTAGRYTLLGVKYSVVDSASLLRKAGGKVCGLFKKKGGSEQAASV